MGISKLVPVKAETKSKPLQNNFLELKAKAIQSRQNVQKKLDVREVGASIKRSRDAKMERTQGNSASEFISKDPVVIGLRFRKAYSYLLGPN